MDESLSLSLRQKQQQTLAPMQLQFVRMLEMTGPELEEEIRRTVDDNPAIEVGEDDDVPLGDTDFNESAEQMQLADYRTDDDIPAYRLEAHNHSASDVYYEPVAVAADDSLMDSLMGQLAENPLVTDRDMEIARFVAGNIDDNGYMTRSVRALVDDIAIQTGWDVTDDDVRRVWNMVRGLEPAGVGAVDLRDSLLIQLNRRENTPTVALAREIIRDYFDLFSLMHFDRMRSLLGVDETRLREALDVIRGLNPKPGALVSGGEDDRVRHITPDFLVETEGDRLTLTLLNKIPHLQIERSFTVEAEGSSRGTRKEVAEAGAFIRQKRDEAVAFMRVLEMRQQTLFRVMWAIVQWQRDFFLTDDPMRIRPMILKDISGVTGDDVSVISRATAGKYVATRQGVYPIKFFFNERRKENDDVSTQKVLAALRRVIDGEDKRRPLSDASIAEALQSEGFDIARRTVTKYREKLGIPVGRLRKGI